MEEKICGGEVQVQGGGINSILFRKVVEVHRRRLISLCSMTSWSAASIDTASPSLA